jgi:tetratricopeptide (TPR) repeat protein
MTKPAPHALSPAIPSSDLGSETPAFQSLSQLNELFSNKAYAQTAQTGQSLLDTEEIRTRPELAIRVTRVVGAAQLALGNYRDALQTLRPAHALASQRNDFPSLVSIDNNIAWIYLKMDNLDGASEYGDQALAALRAERKKDARVLSMCALISSKKKDFKQSNALFAESINYALDTGDLALAANAWYLQGRGYAAASRDAEAQAALTESFHLRKLHHLPDLEVSMRDLAEVLADRGDLRTSTVLLDEAVVAMGNPKSTADTWGFLLDRGRLRMMKGDLNGALPDLRNALALARRLDVIPTDDDRITFESGLAELYSLFIDCGNRLYLRNGNAQLKAEVFEAAEENRAASLRAVVPQPHGWRTQLPPEHAEILAQLQAAERDFLENPDQTRKLQVRRLRISLDQIESRTKPADPSTSISALQTAKNALDSDTAILAFHLGPDTSWLWLLTRESFDVYPLPPKALLANDSKRFRAAIQNGIAVQSLGDSLGTKLLSALPADAHRKHKWIAALDQELFDLPIEALRWNDRYLVEDHAILMTPGIRLLNPVGSAPAWHGRLVAMGDAIYNRADPRFTPSRDAFHWNIFAAGPPDLWHFPRLIGSGKEAHSAVASWGNGAAFTGQDVNKKTFLRISAEHPTILHLATHVIRASVADRSGLIVLGLNFQGKPDFLDMHDILQQPMSAQLIVMSGCASGDGTPRAATGLMGLTRAWLGSGVSDVLATRWPSLDDNGPFFESFYRNLRNNPDQGAAGALQQANLEMLRSHSFRANPEYWANYCLLEKYN